MGDLKVLHSDVVEVVDSKHVLFEVEFSTFIDVSGVEVVPDDISFSSIVETNVRGVEYFDTIT